MKKLMSIFGAVLLASFVITSCSPEKGSEKGSKNSNEENKEVATSPEKGSEKGSKNSNEENKEVATSATDGEEFAKECMCEMMKLQKDPDEEKMEALNEKCMAMDKKLKEKYSDQESAETKDFVSAMQAAIKDCQ